MQWDEWWTWRLWDDDWWWDVAMQGFAATALAGGLAFFGVRATIRHERRLAEEAALLTAAAHLSSVALRAKHGIEMMLAAPGKVIETFEVVRLMSEVNVPSNELRGRAARRWPGCAAHFAGLANVLIVSITNRPDTGKVDMGMTKGMCTLHSVEANRLLSNLEVFE